MARPKTKGALIPVRLALPVDAVVRAKAEAAGMSPGRYLARRLESAFPAEANEAAARQTQIVKRVTCAHLTFDSISGGLRRCKTCGAIRGASGVWRVPEA